MNFQEQLDLLAREVVKIASRRGLTVATAESLTAGMAAAALGGVPGASAVLRGGAVTYCDEIKHRVLGVDERTLAEFTAVSEKTAREMAEGSRKVFDSDIAVSLTGYAGPDGGAPSAPAGTVFIAANDEQGTVCERFRFVGTRNEVRSQAAAKALEMVLSRLEHVCSLR